MAGFADTFESDLLKLIFQALPIADIAQDDTTSPAATITVALHTADPADPGTQSTNETAYTGYVRRTIARSAVGWTVTGNVVSPAANIDFGECTAAPGGQLTHWSVGTGVANKMIGSGLLSPFVTMSVGTVPRLKTTSQITLD